MTARLLVCASRCCWPGVVRLVDISRLRQSKHSPSDIRAGKIIHHFIAKERGNARKQITCTGKTQQSGFIGLWKGFIGFIQHHLFK